MADIYNTGQREVGDLVFSKDVLAISTSEKNWEKTGEVIETVAYHVTLALENDLCLEFQDELNKEDRDTETEGVMWDVEGFLDLRIFIS